MAGRFSIDSIDVGPDDLPGQLPAFGQLRRVLPGPDRPDYVLAELDTPLHHTTTLDRLHAAGVDVAQVEPDVISTSPDGTVTLTVSLVVMAARITGQQVHQGMARFPVNLAYGLGGALHSAEQLEFSMCLPVAVCFVTDQDPAPGAVPG